ncbi:MAG: hypothetical protein AABY22_34380 [Nanoarchaeota archaeon]
MFNIESKKVKELENKILKMEEAQMSFLLKAHEVMKSVLDNDKRKFMYEIRQEDIELIKDGEKYRAIRKIIS